ncbi:sensor histidine kinase [Arsukibacterium ikkense]|uniref:sensor histidine kinase n=1 Tax=Arsukibacterium ikkense TaxID=336831 RepID=UPI00069A157E|nr:HAMP domain-containing sensor histidine kinase [Arsukibacterium ikkense]
MSEQYELNALPCAVIVTDTVGAILFINKWAETAFGLNKSGLPQTLEQLLPLAAQVFLQTHILPMLRKEGVIKEIYIQIKGSQPAQIPMLINAEQGSFNGVDCYRWVMLPAQHRAEFEQQLLKSRRQVEDFAREAESGRLILQAVLDGVKDVGILALSADGSIEFANSGAELIFNAAADELANSQIVDWLRLSEEFSQAFSVLSDANAIQPIEQQRDFETLLNLSDGRQIDVQVQLRRLEPYQTVKALSFILIITDIQQRKRYQALQDNFIANISHELRTPLTTILAALKLLSVDKTSSFSLKTEKLVDLTLKNANRLHQLILDILDFSKLSAGKVSVQVQFTPLATLLEQAINEQLYYLPEKQICIKLAPVETDINIQTDACRFLQVMSNLLSNAKKFSPARSEITIQTEIADGFVKVSIVDEGAGVSKHFIPMLFTQFSQQDDTASKVFEGTGLGLSICKQLTEAMGGQIGYQPGPAGGATFWFTALLAPMNH